MLIIQSLLIVFFLFASSVKMFGWVKPIFEPQLTFFHRYGLNRTIMFLVGVIEATGALAILVGLVMDTSIVSAFGAVCIVATSIGAMFFHFRFDTFKDAIPSMVTLVLSSIVAAPLIGVISSP